MENAELYARCNILPKRDAILYLEKFDPKIKWRKLNKIIDLGSGDGSVTTLLKKYIPSQYTIQGSDKCEKMVNYANIHHGNEQISFTVLDMGETVPQGMKGNFTHVFSSYALHWVLDQETAFRNIFDLMDKGGDCLLIFLANIFVFDVYRNLAHNNKWSDYLQDVENYVSPYIDSEEPDKEIRAIMENIGFEDIDVQCNHMNFIYDMEVMKNISQAVSPFNIPKELYDDFTNDYFEELQKMGILGKVGDGYIPIAPFNYRLLVVYGSKPNKV